MIYGIFPIQNHIFLQKKKKKKKKFWIFFFLAISGTLSSSRHALPSNKKWGKKKFGFISTPRRVIFKGLGFEIQKLPK